MAAQRIETMEAKVRSLPIESWPEADRKAWLSACQPSQRLKRGGAGSHMKSITLNDLSRRYGYFLDFMDRRGLLDLNKAPSAHVTPENVAAILTGLVEDETARSKMQFALAPWHAPEAAQQIAGIILEAITQPAALAQAKVKKCGCGHAHGSAKHAH